MYILFLAYFPDFIRKDRLIVSLCPCVCLPLIILEQTVGFTSNIPPHPRWCLRLVVAVGLACSSDLNSYAGSSIATGRVSKPDRSRVRFQTKRDTLVLQVGGWALG
jgi:hypothetical protein